MRKPIIAAAMAAATLTATPSMAGIFISAVTPGSPVYTGPAPTYTFEGTTPGLSGGTVLSGSSPIGSPPVGGSGRYLGAGPNLGTATLTSLGFAYATTISFIWGSVDPGNTVQFLDGANNVLATFTGTQIQALTSGFAPGATRDDPIVYFTLTGSDSASLRALRFLSATDSFEIDNISVAVPEPATWGMMVMGFAAAGIGLRRRKAVRTSVSFG